MQKSLTPRFLTIGVILAWAVYALLPTWEYQQMTEEEKEELRTLGELEKTESRIIRQGLDLKGGMYIVLEADIPLLVSNLASMKDDRLNKIIDDSKEKSIKQNQDFISVFDTEVRNDGIKLSRYYHEYGASLDQIITSLNEEADDAINRVLEILQNRVDQFGVSEPTIQKQGKHRIVVELAGIQDSDRARALLQSTALLEFYLVKNVSVTNEVIAQLDNALKGDQNLASSLKDDIKETNEVDKEESTTVSELFGEEQVTPNESTENEDFDDDIFLENPFSGLLAAIPGDMGVEEKNLYAFKKLLDREEVKSTLENSNGQFLLSQQSEPITANDPKNYYKLYYLEKRPELTGGIVEEARADLGSLGGGSAGQPVVSLSMNSEGSRTWSRVTGANVGERIAIVLDQKVHMAPSIREKIPGGRTQIEGFADLNEAKDQKYDRVIFFLKKRQKFIYNDLRKFGFIKLLSKNKIDKNPHLISLGPEPLSKYYNFNYFKNYIYQRKKTVKDLLMDQKFVSGLGNIYVNEILFSSKVKPTRKIKFLKDNEIKEIIKNTKKILSKSIKLGGASIKDFSSSNGKKGSFQQHFRAYAREGEKCSNIDCKEKIIRIIISNRSSFYCLSCQK